MVKEMEDKQSKLISVIIPVFNGEMFIEECIESILNNTYKNLEIICVNDGSTDRTGEILEYSQKKIANLTVIAQKNSGVSAARNAGLNNAHGEFISFIDADDTISEHYFSVLLNAIEKNDADVASCNFTKSPLSPISISNIKPAEVLDIGQFYKRKLLRVYVWGKLFKRSILDQVFFEETIRYSEDVAFMTEMLCKTIEKGSSFKGVYIEEPLYYYRFNNSSAVHNYKREVWPAFISWFISRIETQTDPIPKSLYTMELLKKLLVYWYDLHKANDKKGAAEIKKQMQNLSAGLKYNDQFFSRKPYTVLKLFFHFPVLYVHFRKIIDK